MCNPSAMSILDFDYEGTAAVERLQADPDVPTPNYLVSTSPDKWQALWRVRRFRQTAS